jgi:hypothetical protein
MPGTTITRTDSIFATLWEADPMDLKAYVDRRLNTVSGAPSEPAWFSAAFDASWAQAFADAATWCA